MNHFLINGMEKSSSDIQISTLGELMTYLRSHLVNETSLISSLRIDGTEITASVEDSLANVPLTTFDVVEVYTAHPKEIAESTLQTLLIFGEGLESLSKTTGQIALTAEASHEFSRSFGKLVEGIATFTEAITQSKKILRIGLMNPVNLLETDLLEILKDMLEAFQSRQGEYLADLLNVHLPKNIAEWREKGIPAMIRSRDS